MSSNQGNNGSPGSSPGSIAAFVIALIIAFNIFPPLGFLLILWKIGVFKKRTTEKNISSDSRQSIRMDKYRIMTEGRSVESISYLASAVGVSYDTAIRDLQRMVAEGRLGARAYINYVDKTVVLDPAGASAARAASGPATAPQNRPSGGAEGSGMISRAAESDAKKKAASGAASGKAASGPASRSAAVSGPDFKDYDTLKKVMLALGCFLTAAGGVTSLFTIANAGYVTLWDTLRALVPCLSILAGGVGCLAYRGFLKRRENRMKLYAAACAGQDYVRIADLASKAGISERKCRRDLEAMLEKHLLPPSAYIDQGDGLLILKPGAAPQKEPETPVTKPEADNEDRYKAILREIRKLNDDIPDEGVSKRIDEMEDLTGRIFNAVREKPEKEPQIKSFMSYYLPTTLKLLHSYADFDASGAQGENIRSAKAEIEQILDTLVDGFRKQLDKLYEAEAMDISSDIDVLETMLRRDGLTGDGSAFNVKMK